MVPAFLKEKIQSAEGQKISYAAYMEEVLYHQEYGYYMNEKEKIGSKGDFLTSSNVSTIHGQIFARLFVKYFKENSFQPTICEIGGGNGRFASQLLEEVRLLDYALYQSLTYIIIETSPYHLKCQKEVIPNDAAVQFYSSLEEVPLTQMEGIIFSNELFDALPVHVMTKRNGELVEVFVTLNEADNLEETVGTPSSQSVLVYLESNQLEIKEGQRIEVPLAMVEYAKKLSGFLAKGSIITVDYGYTFTDLKMPEHRNGSLRGYFKHTMITDPLQHPSKMDLTTHIHIDALESVFEKEGLTPVCTKRQGAFLVDAGILEHLQENFDTNPFSEKSKRNRAIRSLILDTGWSNSFYVMVYEKNTLNSWDQILHGNNKKR